MTNKKFDREKVSKAVHMMIEAFGEDSNREGLKRTPERVAEFYEEMLSGNYVDAEKLIPVHYQTKNMKK